MLKVPGVMCKRSAIKLNERFYAAPSRKLSVVQNILFLLPTICLLLACSCSSKPAIKNTADLQIGDSKEVALERWGKPDRINRSTGNWGEREQWVYDCIRYVDCYDSLNCFFGSPCFYLYFENGKLIDIYDSR